MLKLIPNALQRKIKRYVNCLAPCLGENVKENLWVSQDYFTSIICKIEKNGAGRTAAGNCGFSLSLLLNDY